MGIHQQLQSSSSPSLPIFPKILHSFPTTKQPNPTITMYFSKIVIALATAATANCAAVRRNEAPSSSNSNCNASQAAACCNTDIVGVLTCSVISEPCKNTAMCCDFDQDGINVNLLSCATVL